ncbi:DUF2460 domain-containing protein [Metapseudomonas resinovorans]|uniref:DUF2460 domain-containing protein n=1 Tax=Metapseudomonas resinovorans TaxID=53412 RepID=UPI0004022DE0|nr:DUF2460 domain-containing protein [Pseudomonas resinovorans]
MGEFIEERLNPCMRIGAEADDDFFTEVTMTAGGGRHVSLWNGKPYRVFNIDYVKDQQDLALEVQSLFYRTYKGFAGFRVKCWIDFTTALDGVSAYTATDCILLKVSAGVYQLLKEYGRDKPGLASIGRPKRIIYKPVAGEVAVAVNGQVLPPAQWSVDTTTGRITLSANKTDAIVGISQAAQAVVDVGTNSFLVGESVAFKDVLGMTQINGLRGPIVAKPDSTHIQVDINTTAFSTYTSGGTVQTHPLDTGSDLLTAGCEFDTPVAFDSAFSTQALGRGIFDVSGLRLVELLNP